LNAIANPYVRRMGYFRGFERISRS
jgi:hypothetical protein